MKNKIPVYLIEPLCPCPPPRGGGRVSVPFLEKGLKGISALFTEVHAQAELAGREGVLHRLDPRVKVVLWLVFVLVIAIRNSIAAEVSVAAVLFLLIAVSRAGIIHIYRRALVFGFLFGFLVALPSSLNIIVPGTVVLPLLHLDRPYQFWIYSVPQEIGLTAEGIRLVGVLTLRVFNSLTVTFLLLATTLFADVIKALRVLRVPDTMLVIISLTYKYLLVFAGTVADTYLAKRARLAGSVSSATAREWIAGRMGFLFRKTRWRCDEIFKAMTARGFNGEVRLVVERRLSAYDMTAAAAGLALAAAILII